MPSIVYSSMAGYYMNQLCTYFYCIKTLNVLAIKINISTFRPFVVVAQTKAAKITILSSLLVSNFPSSFHEGPA